MKVVPTLPVVELKRAREFYEKKLGLKVIQSGPTDIFFECGEGTILYIYQRAQTKADHTVAGFVVTDIEAETKILREKGIMFDEFDLPEMKTVNGIVTKAGGDKTAWFKDTEGNILALHQMSK